LVLGVVFGDDQFNGVIQIYLGLSLVAMATKFGTKWAITQLLLEISARSFGVGPSNTDNKILLQPTFVAMAMKFETKSYNSDSVRDISTEIFASNGRFWRMGY